MCISRAVDNSNTISLFSCSPIHVASVTSFAPIRSEKLTTLDDENGPESSCGGEVLGFYSSYGLFEDPRLLARGGASRPKRLVTSALRILESRIHFFSPGTSHHPGYCDTPDRGLKVGRATWQMVSAIGAMVSAQVTPWFASIYRDNGQLLPVGVWTVRCIRSNSNHLQRSRRKRAIH